MPKADVDYPKTWNQFMDWFSDEIERELNGYPVTEIWNQTNSGKGKAPANEWKNWEMVWCLSKIQEAFLFFWRVHWMVNNRPHGSLNFEKLETPEQAFWRKMPPEAIFGIGNSILQDIFVCFWHENHLPFWFRLDRVGLFGLWYKCLKNLKRIRCEIIMGLYTLILGPTAGLPTKLNWNKVGINVHDPSGHPWEWKCYFQSK